MRRTKSLSSQFKPAKSEIKKVHPVKETKAPSVPKLKEPKLVKLRRS